MVDVPERDEHRGDHDGPHGDHHRGERGDGDHDETKTMPRKNVGVQMAAHDHGDEMGMHEDAEKKRAPRDPLAREPETMVRKRGARDERAEREGGERRQQEKHPIVNRARDVGRARERARLGRAPAPSEAGRGVVVMRDPRPPARHSARAAARKTQNDALVREPVDEREQKEVHAEHLERLLDGVDERIPEVLRPVRLRPPPERQLDAHGAAHVNGAGEQKPKTRPRRERPQEGDERDAHHEDHERGGDDPTEIKDARELHQRARRLVELEHLVNRDVRKSRGEDPKWAACLFAPAADTAQRSATSPSSADV